MVITEDLQSSLSIVFPSTTEVKFCWEKKPKTNITAVKLVQEAQNSSREHMRKQSPCSPLNVQEHLTIKQNNKLPIWIKIPILQGNSYHILLLFWKTKITSSLSWAAISHQASAWRNRSRKRTGPSPHPHTFKTQSSYCFFSFPLTFSNMYVTCYGLDISRKENTTLTT